jgi:hypothetical protein
MPAIALGQAAVDLGHALAEHRRGPAVVHAAADLAAVAGLPDALHLGVGLGQPGRLAGAGGGEDGETTGGGEAVHDAVEPVERPHVRGRLHRRPGEDAHRQVVEPGAREEREVLVDDLGALQPLVGIPVGAMDEMGMAGVQRRIAHTGYPMAKTGLRH